MNEKEKILVIINPVSGTTRKDEMPKLINDLLDHKKWDVSISFTAFPGHASILAQEAIDNGYHVVATMGGDGTINEVASTLGGSNVALGLIPCGSGNGFARHLHISTNVKEAINIINNGFITQVDYCTVNDLPFFCTCGTGFDAKVSKKFAESDTRGVITYIKTTINEFFNTRGEHYHIDIDNEHIEEKKAFVVACCNAAQYGNNAFIAPHASMQDGLIDMTIIHNFNIVDGTLLAARLLTKQIDKDRHVSIYRGKKIVIKRDHPDIIHIDGDPKMMPSELSFTCIKKGLNVIVEQNLENVL